MGVTATALACLLIITGAAFLYWFDDLFELSGRLRMAICLVTGVAIAVCLGLPAALSVTLLVLLAVTAGFASIALVNMVNFADGADVNLATMFMLTAAMLLIYAPAGSDWYVIAIGITVFTLPFMLFNRRAKTIYLGDSGSFAFANLYALMGVAFLISPASVPPEAAFPLALPFVDTAFVFAVRVYERHDLLTRHYLHLYQRLQSHFSGFLYLSPQILSVALCWLLAWAFQAVGMSRLPAAVLAMGFVATTVFLVFRQLWISKSRITPEAGISLT